jgi:transcriptional regulator with XRE-family HTH domain
MTGSRHAGVRLRFPLLEQLRRERQRRGLHLADLAVQTGYHRTTIGRWERGEDYPSIAALDDICQSIGLELVISLQPAVAPLPARSGSAGP